MRWTMIVMVFGTEPVETGLVYDTLSSCMVAQTEARRAYADHFNTLSAEWGPSMSEEERKRYVEYWNSTLLSNRVTCIPTK